MNVGFIGLIVAIIIIVILVIIFVMKSKEGKKCPSPLPDLPDLWNNTWKLRNSLDGPVIANITFDNFGITHIVTAKTDKPFEGTAFNGMKTSQTYKVTNDIIQLKLQPQFNPKDPEIYVKKNECNTAWVVSSLLGSFGTSYLTV